MFIISEGIVKARKKAYEKWQELEDKRGEEIYDYIEEHPEESAYSLSKKFLIPRSSLQKILNHFIKDGLLAEELKIENRRMKKIYRVRKFNEYKYNDTINRSETLLQLAQNDNLIQEFGSEAIMTLNSLVNEFNNQLINRTRQKKRQSGSKKVTKEDFVEAYNEMVVKK